MNKGTFFKVNEGATNCTFSQRAGKRRREVDFAACGPPEGRGWDAGSVPFPQAGVVTGLLPVQAVREEGPPGSPCLGVKGLAPRALNPWLRASICWGRSREQRALHLSANKSPSTLSKPGATPQRGASRHGGFTPQPPPRKLPTRRFVCIKPSVRSPGRALRLTRQCERARKATLAEAKAPHGTAWASRVLPAAAPARSSPSHWGYPKTRDWRGRDKSVPKMARPERTLKNPPSQLKQREGSNEEARRAGEKGRRGLPGRPNTHASFS